MMEQRFSDNEVSRRDIPSFIEPRPPLINNPFMRPRPQKGTNLLELFEEDSELEEPELVQVYLRMKPHDGPNNLYEVRSDKCLVTSLDTTTAGHGRRTQHNVSRMYTFSRIFNAESSQKEIFEQVVKENLKKLPDGHSFTLLTYGASGSGKTFTLMGTVNSPGLVPRSLEYVFKLVDSAQTPLYKPSDGSADKLGFTQQEFELQWVKKLRQVSGPQRDKYRRMSAQLRNDLTTSNFDLANRTKYYVWVSFVEIYNEAIYDLLAPPDKRMKLRIREDASGQVFVKGVTQAFVRSGVEAYDVMVAGKHNLVVAATGIHAHSSRSHCIFTITMLTDTDGEIRTSCIRLCDLAGSERARATRNTGARMQESRSINSSLHVLERCLHLLRRNQRQRQEAMVPYRESKLTRLLGSGLSGSRGEAVSMVVTLNPSPQYAQETKHVLSLAAVAQDIQINHTAMFASTMESSVQDTTVAASADVMKLRSDNERLHFELVQAQARNRELLAAMEEKQEQAATTMRELVEEAKDMTRQYYETQMEALRSEIRDMMEEFEARLAKAPAPADAAVATPTRFLQAKVAHLATEIHVLEDKLSAEKLARGRAEEELKHLRTCIDERDEKAYIEPETFDGEEVVLTDSEDEGSDPFNQSLEPVFRQECMNRSKAIKTDETIHKHDENDDKEESAESKDTIKQDNDDVTLRNSDYETGDESVVRSANLTNTFDTINDSNVSKARESDRDDQSCSETKSLNEVEAKSIVRGTYFVQDSIKDSPVPINVNKSEYVDNLSARGTFVSDIQQDNGPNESIELKNEVRGTYFVRNSVIDTSSDEESENKETKQANKESESSVTRETNFVRKSATYISDDEKIEDENKETGDFETESPIKNCLRTSAIDTSIDEEMQEVVEHKTKAEEISTKRQSDDFLPPKQVSETLVSKILQSLKKSTHNNVSDSSLIQFEQLEIASQNCKDDSAGTNSAFGEIKIFKKKRTYFDEHKSMDDTHISLKTDATETIIRSNKTKDFFGENLNTENISDTGLSCKKKEEKDIKENKSNDEKCLITKPVFEKRTNYDNIEVTETAPNKKVAEIITSARKCHDRSPSIVSDDIEPFEPSTMTKLLGENKAKIEVLSLINKVITKPASMDVFESPQFKLKEVAPSPAKVNCSSLDDVRKSIEKLVLSQKTRNDSKQEMKLKLSVEETENKIAQNIPTIIIINKHEDKPSTELNETYKKDNTIEEFEKIYKDISTQRPTEFDLLTTTQEIDANTIDTNVENVVNTESDKENVQKANEPEIEKKEGIKYNLRHKSKPVLNTSEDKNKNEILLETTAKCESKKFNKRNLRLRRRENDNENSDHDQKLKDILNLKKEFSDVTLGLPAVKKDVKDIPSPEKLSGEENFPPLMGIQSCPSKSVIRSRRKLFTPRAEPLDESLDQAGDSSDRVYVPRPSYHRVRARRKL